jgi:hypothetical protein
MFKNSSSKVFCIKISEIRYNNRLIDNILLQDSARDFRKYLIIIKSKASLILIAPACFAPARKEYFKYVLLLLWLRLF